MDEGERMIVSQCSAQAVKIEPKNSGEGIGFPAILSRLQTQRFQSGASGWLGRIGVDILCQSLQRTVRGPAHLFPAVPDSAQELQLKVFTEAR